MTEILLVALIFQLCSPLKGYEAERLACFDSYTNCAVLADGSIMSEKQFKADCGVAR